jgi:membrane protein DedA with SNARE-associated domain
MARWTNHRSKCIDFSILFNGLVGTFAPLVGSLVLYIHGEFSGIDWDVVHEFSTLFSSLADTFACLIGPLVLYIPGEFSGIDWDVIHEFSTLFIGLVVTCL